MARLTLAVLVPLRPGAPPGTPEEMPIGRAALALWDKGVEVLFAGVAEDGALSGFIAEPGRWRAVSTRSVHAVYDRYPSQKDPQGHAALCAGLGEVPLANPIALTLLCRDKLACHRHLEAHGVPQPDVESAHAHFEARLAGWGAGFLKPRYGAFGQGVVRVVPGDELPAQTVGMLPDVLEPTLVQRAISPPPGWAGVSVRVLVQRSVDGGWVVNPGVARRSRTDPVVNVHRGAEAAPAEDMLGAKTVAATEELVRAAARALAQHPDGDLLVELGVDVVIDPDGAPHLIEVNSRPRGRLEALAARDPERFEALHVEACCRPLRFLAQWRG